MKITVEDVLVRVFLNDKVIGEYTALKRTVSQIGVSIWVNSPQGKLLAKRDGDTVVVEFSQRSMRGGIEDQVMATSRQMMGVK